MKFYLVMLVLNVIGMAAITSDQFGHYFILFTAYVLPEILFVVVILWIMVMCKASNRRPR